MNPTATNISFNNKNGVKRPQLTRNQFGDSLGRPLPFLRFGEGDPNDSLFASGKDRLLFFFNYEGRQDAQGISYARIVPLDHFQNPRNGEVGNRNFLRSGNLWNLDLGLQKNFRLPWEGTPLQFRADAFNGFNHHVFGLPNANINSNSFGQITTSASSPREL